MNLYWAIVLWVSLACIVTGSTMIALGIRQLRKEKHNGH